MKNSFPFVRLFAAALSFSMAEEGTGVVAIEDLMDASLDDLKDLPGFVVPPVGHYKLLVSLETKKINDHPSIQASCTVLETFELANKNETPVENGTKFSQLFMMDNEWGQGGFKGFALPISEGLKLVRPPIKEVVAAIQNITIAATIKHRYHKEDRALPVGERRVFADLKNVEVQ
jgi:hypothetical protein